MSCIFAFLIMTCYLLLVIISICFEQHAWTCLHCTQWGGTTKWMLSYGSFSEKPPILLSPHQMSEAFSSVAASQAAPPYSEHRLSVHKIKSPDNRDISFWLTPPPPPSDKQNRKTDWQAKTMKIRNRNGWRKETKETDKGRLIKVPLVCCIWYSLPFLNSWFDRYRRENRNIYEM